MVHREVCTISKKYKRRVKIVLYKKVKKQELEEIVTPINNIAHEDKHANNIERLEHNTFFNTRTFGYRSRFLTN